MPRDKVIPLHPAPEIPRVDYCAQCWPWRLSPPQGAALATTVQP